MASLVDRGWLFPPVNKTVEAINLSVCIEWARVTPARLVP